MDIKEEIKNIGYKEGATLFGVANLDDYREEINEIYGDKYNYLPKAISFAVPYPKVIVNELIDGPTHTYLYYYKILNTKLDDIALRVAIFLEKMGYKSLPIPASQRVGDDRLDGIFSHRLAAHLGGVGWIGKNLSLITKEYGPRIRLVTILTDAPLEVDAPYSDDGCKSCALCVDNCPSGAILGKLFNMNESVEERFIGKYCDEHLSRVRTTFGKRICGKCLASCPYGRS